MTIAKKQILKMIKGFPNRVDVDELIYRLYLQKKLEAAESDVRAGRLIPHEKVKKDILKWFR